MMEISLIAYPTSYDWIGVKQRAMITIYGKGIYGISEPTDKWKRRILEARHSPIRHLRFSFLFEDIPSNVATHFCRHVHAQPYVSSLRNDRQDAMNGDEAPRNTPVNMILDVNAEELMVMANKRLCHLASAETRKVMKEMCRLVEEACPEFVGLLVPMCEYNGGICHEMKGCGRCPQWRTFINVDGEAFAKVACNVRKDKLNGTDSQI